jgi:homocysteine S-methyltransferase
MFKILDGAFGSVLIDRLKLKSENLSVEELNQSNPEDVIRLHLDYIRAGADIISTNTMCASSSYLGRLGKESLVTSLNLKAVELVKKAIQRSAQTGVEVAGVLSSEIYDQNTDDLQLAALIASGVDYIGIETFSCPEKVIFVLEKISRLCTQSSPKVRVWVSFYCTDFVTIEALKEIQSFSFVEFLGLNCSFSSSDFNDFMSLVPKEMKLIFYPSAPIDIFEFQKTIESYLKRLGIIGSCCGSNPNVSKKILKMRNFLSIK